MKKYFLLGLLMTLTGAVVGAAETGHAKITDPNIYIPLRENMTEMELKFVDIQILSAADAIDFKAIQKGLDQMEAAAKKIRSINPKENMREPLAKLSDQLGSLKRDVRRKDAASLKANLDRLFETCFKCHQAHAPLMKQ